MVTSIYRGALLQLRIALPLLMLCVFAPPRRRAKHAKVTELKSSDFTYTG